mmetsp:Transcript_20262/g.54033  ORF Transcript_20262/g.54033 Transcript_20262/m.54033 type:complete len:210 (+) Transcript_20262:497-1126(+)
MHDLLARAPRSPAPRRRPRRSRPRRDPSRRRPPPRGRPGASRRRRRHCRRGVVGGVFRIVLPAMARHRPRKDQRRVRGRRREGGCALLRGHRTRRHPRRRRDRHRPAPRAPAPRSRPQARAPRRREVPRRERPPRRSAGGSERGNHRPRESRRGCPGVFCQRGDARCATRVGAPRVAPERATHLDHCRSPWGGRHTGRGFRTSSRGSDV